MAEINSNEPGELPPDNVANANFDEKETVDNNSLIVDTVDSQSASMLINNECSPLTLSDQEQDQDDLPKLDDLANVEVEIPDFQDLSAEWEKSFSGAVFEADNEDESYGINDINNITFTSFSSVDEPLGSNKDNPLGSKDDVDIAPDDDETMDANATLHLIQILINENKSQRKLVQDMKTTLRFVMSKYRQSVTYFLQQPDNNVFKDVMRKLEDVQLKTYSETELGLEMINVMTLAANMDDSADNLCSEIFAKLSLENKGLREMLNISTNFERTTNYADKAVQTNGMENDYYYFMSDDECSFHTARSPTGSLNSFTIDMDKYHQQGSSGSDSLSDDGVSSVREAPFNQGTDSATE